MAILVENDNGNQQCFYD